MRRIVCLSFGEYIFYVEHPCVFYMVDKGWTWQVCFSFWKTIMGAREMAQWLEHWLFLPRVQSQFPAEDCLQLQTQVLWCPLLTSIGSCMHAVHKHTFRIAHKHKMNKLIFKKKKAIINVFCLLFCFCFWFMWWRHSFLPDTRCSLPCLVLLRVQVFSFMYLLVYAGNELSGFDCWLFKIFSLVFKVISIC